MTSLIREKENEIALTIAKEANKIAKDANLKADQANFIASKQSSKTTISITIAVLALLISITTFIIQHHGQDKHNGKQSKYNYSTKGKTST